MKFSPAHYLLPLLPALVFSTRQNYKDLEKKLKEIAKERSSILHEMAKTSRDLVGIKSNLQSLRNEEKYSIINVHRLLEIGNKQREQLKSLHETLQVQLKDANEKVEKQQTTITFLKTELERKSKMIRDLQNENKSLKNKLLSGNKLCGIRAEEARKIQAQLKEIHYGKKDLLAKAHRLKELEQKLIMAKKQLNKAALDKDSQIKAMKETIRLCLSTVFQNPQETITIPQASPSMVPFSQAPIASLKLEEKINNKSQHVLAEKRDDLQEKTSSGENLNVTACDPNEGRNCLANKDSILRNDSLQNNITMQKFEIEPCTDCDEEKEQEKRLVSFEERTIREEKIL
ncbi:leucine zipper protein 2 [Suncus etruscus]|uniref:leucine zipper protein 2 n=1 Tax=Suncus etruscus TaxID=109475 RepID=UPI00210FDF6E|nr:leucine zipper protein 2 [Suncus etruscus]